MYCIESKLEALAQCAFKNEDEIQQLEILVCPDSKAHSKPTDELMCQIDSKVDQKLQDFLNGPVTDALRAALEAFSSHVGVKIQSLDDQLAILMSKDPAGYKEQRSPRSEPPCEPVETGAHNTGMT